MLSHCRHFAPVLRSGVAHSLHYHTALTHATRTGCGVLHRSEALSSSARGALTEQLPFSGHVSRCAALFTPSRLSTTTSMNEGGISPTVATTALRCQRTARVDDGGCDAFLGCGSGRVGSCFHSTPIAMLRGSLRCGLLSANVPTFDTPANSKSHHPTTANRPTCEKERRTPADRTFSGPEGGEVKVMGTALSHKSPGDEALAAASTASVETSAEESPAVPPSEASAEGEEAEAVVRFTSTGATAPTLSRPRRQRGARGSAPDSNAEGSAAAAKELRQMKRLERKGDAALRKRAQKIQRTANRIAVLCQTLQEMASELDASLQSVPLSATSDRLAKTSGAASSVEDVEGEAAVPLEIAEGS